MVTMRRREDSRAGTVIFGLDMELEHWVDYTIFDIREL
jgi:hypothetical protein